MYRRGLPFTIYQLGQRIFPFLICFLIHFSVSRSWQKNGNSHFPLLPLTIWKFWSTSDDGCAISSYITYLKNLMSGNNVLTCQFHKVDNKDDKKFGINTVTDGKPKRCCRELFSLAELSVCWLTCKRKNSVCKRTNWTKQTFFHLCMFLRSELVGWWFVTPYRQRPVRQATLYFMSPARLLWVLLAFYESCSPILFFQHEAEKIP